MFAKNKIPKRYEELSRFEQKFYWITSASIGQKSWFLVGALCVSVLMALGLFDFGSLLIGFVAYFVVCLSVAIWMKSTVPTEYWKPYSNTPGHGIKLVSYVPRGSAQGVSNLWAFQGGFLVGPFAGILFAAIGDANALPALDTYAVTPAIAIFVSGVTALGVMLFVEESPFGI